MYTQAQQFYVTHNKHFFQEYKIRKEKKTFSWKMEILLKQKELGLE